MVRTAKSAPYLGNVGSMVFSLPPAHFSACARSPNLRLALARLVTNLRSTSHKTPASCVNNLPSSQARAASLSNSPPRSANRSPLNSPSLSVSPCMARTKNWRKSLRSSHHASSFTP